MIPPVNRRRSVHAGPYKAGLDTLVRDLRQVNVRRLTLLIFAGLVIRITCLRRWSLASFYVRACKRLTLSRVALTAAAGLHHQDGFPNCQPMWTRRSGSKR